MKNTTNATGKVVRSKEAMQQSLMQFLTGDLTGIDQNLIDRVKYTTEKSLSKVTAKDLNELCTEVSEAIKKAVLEQREQAAKKPNPKKTIKEKSLKSRAKAQKPEVITKPDDLTPNNEVKSEKPAKKLKSNKVVSFNTSSKTETVVTMFPDSFEAIIQGEKTTLVKKSFNSYQEVSEFANGNDHLFIATYWNPKQIKQYRYSESYRVPCPKAFPNDLDLLQVLMECELINRLIGMSHYTNALFSFDEDEIDYIPCKTPDGKPYEVRIANGMEYEFYVKA